MKLQDLDGSTRKTALGHGRVAFHKQYEWRGLDGRLKLLPRFLSQPSACSGQVLGASDGPRELPNVHQHGEWSIRVRTALTEELTRLRSISRGAVAE